MPRPPRTRFVCHMPDNLGFAPLGVLSPGNITMTVDEFETIRLIDWEGCSQEECAEHMHIARTTVQTVYESARKKTAECMIKGRRLIITGGEYELCPKFGNGCKGRFKECTMNGKKS